MNAPEPSGQRRKSFEQRVVVSDHKPRGSPARVPIVKGPSHEPGRITIAGDQDQNIRARRDAKVASKIVPSGITVDWEKKDVVRSSDVT